MEYGRHIRAFRKSKGLTQDQLGEIAGISGSAISQWESDDNEPTMRALERIATHFDVPKSEILGDISVPKGAIVPKAVEAATMTAYGTIAAGIPLEMCEIVEDIEVPVSIRERHPYAYFLIVSGDSMNNEVLDGHYAMIDPDAEVRNGDIAAVNVNGYDATLKRWHKTHNSVILSPDSTNPEHKDIVIDETSPDAPNLRILGKYLMSISPYRG
jgi:repressor LexA